MNKYKINVVFTVNAEDLRQAYRIIEHEIDENVRFNKVPYSLMTDSGIINYGVTGEVDGIQEI